MVDVDRGFLDKTGESTKENTHITKDRYTEYIRTHSSLINRQKIWTLYKEKCKNTQKIHEKLFNINSHEGNGNQKYT